MKDKTVKGMNSRGQCWPAPKPFYTIEINTYRARRRAGWGTKTMESRAAKEQL